MIKNKMHKAIAMIELIFAIVIFGIVMMSAPTLITTATKSSILVLQQEAIAAISSDLSMIMTRYWDENDANETKGSPILTTSGSSVFNNVDVNGSLTGHMAGTPPTSYRSFVDDLGTIQTNATAPDNFGPNFAVTGENDNSIYGYDDIDDFDDLEDAVTSGGLVDTNSTAADRGDYVDSGDNLGSGGMLLYTVVQYMDDSNLTPNSTTMTFNFNDDQNVSYTTNIKHVSIRVTNRDEISEIKKDIAIRAFSCNIGSYKLEKKDF